MGRGARIGVAVLAGWVVGALAMQTDMPSLGPLLIWIAVAVVVYNLTAPKVVYVHAQADDEDDEDDQAGTDSSR